MFNFRKINPNNLEISQVQSNVDDVFKQLRNSIILDGVLIQNVIIEMAATTIDHTLKRQPLGFIIVDKDKVADIYRTAWTPTTLSLISSALTTTISLWIF